MTDNFAKHEYVTCTVPIPRLQLSEGAPGVVVHLHGQGLAYEVEFMRDDGNTIGVETCLKADLRHHVAVDPVVK